MLTEFGYLLAWAVYLGCAVVLYWALGFVFNRLGPKVIQYFFKTIIAVLLFTPAISVPDQNLWAPAYLVAGYSYVQDQQLLAIQATLLMIVAWCVICLLLALSYLLKRIRQQGPAHNTTAAQKDIAGRHQAVKPTPNEARPAQKPSARSDRQRLTPTV